MDGGLADPATLSSSQKTAMAIRTAFDPLGSPAKAPSDTKGQPESGRVYASGSGEYAACGVPPAKKHHPQNHAASAIRTPHLLTTLLEKQIVQVSCGWRHSAIVLTSGELYAVGDGEHGKLGLGEDTSTRVEPTLVPLASSLPVPVRVTFVSCGHSHTAFVCSAGDLYTFGLGLYGQLGHGSLRSETSPRHVEVVGGSAMSVSCGGLHTLALRADGVALSCGFNEAGRLGRVLAADGSPASIAASSATSASSEPAAAVCAERLAPLHLEAVVAVSAGGAHSALVTADGGAHTCGRGESGQLGHGTPNAELLPRRVGGGLRSTKLRRAACGDAHTLLLSSTGVPYACGCGGFGRLGLGGRASVLVPTPVGGPLASVVVVQIAAGSAHSAFVSESGQVYTCGDDGEGQCGTNAAAATLVPTVPPKFAGGAPTVLGASCGGAHTAFLLASVIDAKRDYREDQLEVAAATIEAFFRGHHQRYLQEHAEHRKLAAASLLSRKRGARYAAEADSLHRQAAARVIQSSWRVHWKAKEKEKARQLSYMRGLRNEAKDDPAGWDRAKRQLDAAVVGAAFGMAGARLANTTKPSW